MQRRALLRILSIFRAMRYQFCKIVSQFTDGRSGTVRRENLLFIRKQETTCDLETRRTIYATVSSVAIGEGIEWNHRFDIYRYIVPEFNEIKVPGKLFRSITRKDTRIRRVVDNRAILRARVNRKCEIRSFRSGLRFQGNRF